MEGTHWRFLLLTCLGVTAAACGSVQGPGGGRVQCRSSELALGPWGLPVLGTTGSRPSVWLPSPVLHTETMLVDSSSC